MTRMFGFMRKNLGPGAGFTLLEISMVIIIVGLLMIPLVHMYDLFLKDRRMNDTRERIDDSVRSLALFSPTRFPCPSDRSLPPTDPQYGFEKCTGIPACTGAYQGICRVNGTRDTAIDADAQPDPVIIGGVPFRYLIGTNVKQLPQLRGEDTIDGWDNRLTYAVSEKLTDITKTSSLNDYQYGVIAAVNEHGNPTAGISAIGDAQLVVVSHGPSGAGAFNYQGISSPCAIVGTDRENCDNDSLFVQGLGNYEASGAGFYDDTVYFFLESGGDLWTTLNDASGQPGNHLNNLNQNNIGINVVSPTEKLDVGGVLRAPTTRSNSYCDKSGANCFPADYFDGVKIAPSAQTNTCTTGKIMTGISSLQAECAKPTIVFPLGFSGVTCPGGHWLTGVLTNGCIECTNGAKVCP